MNKLIDSVWKLAAAWIIGVLLIDMGLIYVVSGTLTPGFFCVMLGYSIFWYSEHFVDYTSLH